MSAEAVGDDSASFSWPRALAEALRFAPVFPLPLIPKPPHPGQTRSRRVLQRYRRAMALCTVANRIVESSNELEGSRFQVHLPWPGQRARPGVDLSGVEQDHGLRHFYLRMVQAAVPLRDGRRAWPTGARWQEPFRSLAADVYQRTSVDRYEPIVAGRLAEPEPGAGVVKMLEWLPDGARETCAEKQCIMRPGMEGSEELKEISRR